MSTLINNTISKRFLILAQIGEDVYHVDDLANLWEIEGNNLRTTLKRYVQRGLLNRVYRGFYSIKPIDEVDPWVLGAKALHRYAYIGTETILFKNGIINQAPQAITLVSSKNKRITIGPRIYRSRQLSDKFLTNPVGLYKEKNILISTTERAVADLIYFNPDYYFDNEKLINWRRVKEVQKSLGYPPMSKKYETSRS